MRPHKFDLWNCSVFRPTVKHVLKTFVVASGTVGWHKVGILKTLKFSMKPVEKYDIYYLPLFIFSVD